jgi:ABC-type taurine transport system ATPase subunit
MSTEWLLTTHDIEIAADIEREIARMERPDGRIGDRFGIDYATGLPLRDVEPVAGPNDAVQQRTT